MKNNLHVNEARYLSIYKSPVQQYQSFIQFWVSKEAFLKALGVGIGDDRFPLHSLDFSNFLYSSSHYSIHQCYYKNQLLEGWIFITLLVDDVHILGIACGPKQDNVDDNEWLIGKEGDDNGLLLGRILEENDEIYKASGNCTISIVCSDSSLLL